MEEVVLKDTPSASPTSGKILQEEERNEELLFIKKKKIQEKNRREFCYKTSVII